ncbi:hypothetical protein JXQ70_02520 [bacterium]|nr:hypothetical protein [bacterium]
MTGKIRNLCKVEFVRLSARRQHDVLADIAESFLESGSYSDFLGKYHKYHSWVELDKYEPAYWLSNEEALQEYILFHRALGKSSQSYRTDAALKRKLTWEPTHQVEVAIDQIRSPYNVGSILRLMDNFGFKGLVHSTSWLRPDHPQLCKAARGTESWIPVTYCPDLVQYLRKSRVRLIGLENDQRAIPLHDWEPTKQCIVVLGNEEYGIARVIRELCDQLVTIPLIGFKKSLNVHHAFAIFAHYYDHWFRSEQVTGHDSENKHSR